MFMGMCAHTLAQSGVRGQLSGLVLPFYRVIQHRASSKAALVLAETSLSPQLSPFKAISVASTKEDVRYEGSSFTELSVLHVPSRPRQLPECGTSVFIVHEEDVPGLCQNKLCCGTLGLWIFRRAVINSSGRTLFFFVYNAYYMKSSIFNNKCAIFLIFIALMCARGFSNWFWDGGNFPEILSTTVVVSCPQFAQVVNYETWWETLGSVSHPLQMPICSIMGTKYFYSHF